MGRKLVIEAAIKTYKEIFPEMKYKNDLITSDRYSREYVSICLYDDFKYYDLANEPILKHIDIFFEEYLNI